MLQNDLEEQQITIEQFREKFNLQRKITALGQKIC